MEKISKILSADQYNNEKKYWLNVFADNFEVAKFEMDRDITYTNEGGKAIFSTCLSGEICQRLTIISKNSDYARYVVILGGLMTLLNRYTNLSDIIIGTPVFSQNAQKDLINNILPIRYKVNNQGEFRDTLNGLKSVVKNAIENQNYPLEALAMHLGLENISDFNSIFDIGFVYENIQVCKYIEDQNISICFKFKRENDIIHLIVEYSSNKYSEKYIKKLLKYFMNILEVCLNDPQILMEDIELLNKKEKNDILEKLNNNIYQIPRGNYLDLFEKQADNNPFASVVQYNNKILTFRQVVDRYKRLAQELKHYNVEAGTPVGVLMERSDYMFISILAIWCAGGIYVPLSTEYPGKRILNIINDSKLDLLLITSDVKLEDEICLKVSSIKVDQIDSQKSLKNDECFKNEYDRCKHAYIIYTSGSTGLPKGVIVDHKGMLNHIFAKIFDLNINSESVIAQNASQTFDISIWQFFAAPLCSGKIVINDKKLILKPIEFIKNIYSSKISILELVPSYLKLILDNLEKIERHYISSLKFMLVTGEAIKPSLIEKYFAVFTNTPLVNAYGPTEASDDITHFVILPDKKYTTTVPIGKPIINTNIYILDKFNHICPIGHKGELCVTGICVGQGYLNNVEKTFENYKNSIFQEDSYKMYRTGDICSVDDEGIISFYGRVDDQIKINGYRIELSEIENVIAKIKGVKESVVLKKLDEMKNDMLLAFYSSVNNIPVKVFKQLLSEYLPVYMIPEFYIRLDDFPININGKIDKNNLLAINIDKYTENQTDEMITEEEKVVLDIWKLLLNKNSISIHDNLFEIGGDSIKSIQIAAKVNELGYSINIEDLFKYPTIHSLISNIKKEIKTIEQSKVIGDVKLAPYQAHYFDFYSKELHYFNQSVLISSKERINTVFLYKILHKILDHHDALRTTFKINNGKINQYCNEKSDIFIQEFDLREESNPEMIFTQQVNSIQSSIDLENGPLLKTGLFHFSDGDRLLLTVHHLVVDYYSWIIIQEDIMTLWNQLTTQKTLELPLKTESFRNWTENLNKYANSYNFLKESEYWKKIEETKVNKLPKDFNESNISNKHLSNLTLTLDHDTTYFIQNSINQVYNTNILDILISALSITFNSIFNTESLALALESHGRYDLGANLDVSRTVGWFTSVFPVILDTQPDNDIRKQIIDVKDMLHRIPNKGMGYRILKYITSAEHKTDILFNLQPEILFNYIGVGMNTNQDGDHLELAEESTGYSISPNQKQEYALIFTAIIENERLNITIEYYKKQYKKKTISNILECYIDVLKKIADYCKNVEKGEQTVSDFSDNDLNTEELEFIRKAVDL